MQVAILSDSPTATTGFGRTTARIAGAIGRDGHDVWCFGIRATPADVAATADPAYRIWPADQGGHWTATLARFFATVRPDVLLLNMDAFNAMECLDVCAASGWGGPTVSYVCFDGLPVAREYLDAQRRCTAVWTTSSVAAAYLASEGLEVAGVAPPGVDPGEFQPHPDPEALRSALGLASSTVVGVFGTNTDRKQIPRALAGFVGAVRTRPDLKLRLYLHCRPDGFWRLDEMAQAWGVGDRVLFAGPRGFREHLGTALRNGCDGGVDPSGLGYIERLSMCHAIVNVPYNGDVEQVIPEAQACGVPLLHTDDEGVMRDALGEGGVGLAAADVGYGRLGQRMHHVDPRNVTAALVDVLGSGDRVDELREAGHRNAARFDWTVLERAACAMVLSITDRS